MKAYFGSANQHPRHRQNLDRQPSAARLRLMNDKANSAPRAVLAFSALSAGTWLRNTLSLLARRLATSPKGSPVSRKADPKIYGPNLCCAVLVLLSLCRVSLQAQQAPAADAVPRLVTFSGKLTNSRGTPAQATGITFAIYKEEEGGAPLWIETQNVRPDNQGRYTVQLGTSKPGGLPLDLFSTGDARWLGVRVNSEEEQARVLLLSVPYALKAADAQTLGGLPPSAFVLATPATGNVSSAESPETLATSIQGVTTPAISGAGTTNFVPLWLDSKGTLGNSAVFQSSTGASAKVGIGTTTPTTTLDVKGSATVRGNVNLPATGTATATAGKTSQPATLTASTFNSSTKAAVAQNFRWQAEPAGNNTAGASGTLNLLFGRAAAAPTETGLKIASNGHITFASGQPFPGTGTVTSVGLSAPVSDFAVINSPVTGSGLLNLQWVVPPNSSDVATAIVKRDAFGDFAAHFVSVSGVQASTVSATTVSGATVSGTNSALGPFSSAVIGINQATGVVNGFGVFGDSNSGVGAGVIGASEAGGIGMLGQSGFHNNGGQGVWGESVGAAISANGFGPDGVDGFSHANAGSGVAAINTASGDGLYASSSGGLAGHFAGNVDVNGNLSKNGGSFKIDHPLDPANKYLYHSFVESPDMMDIYNGRATTDADGNAVVQLPEWFEALNRDFRYQLTVIGQFAQAIIGSEIANNRFTIRTDKPNVKISWQVTGIRHDAWANAHRIPTEQPKPEDERGLYQHPELFGMPAEKSIEAAKHPGVTKAMKAGRTPIAPGSLQ